MPEIQENKIPESYHFLQNKLGLNKNFPYTKDWSAAADFLQIIADHCLNSKPTTILECSSGLTTLILARCCQMNHHGHVYSLENGEEYVTKTRDSLNQYHLDDYASVIHAPLVNTNINDKQFLWYEIESVPDKTIDMLVIDGPPGFIQQHSRYPAIPMLYKKLASQCKIFMDDADRDDEKEIVKLWLSEYPSIKHEYIDTERGCSVLIINGK